MEKSPQFIVLATQIMPQEVDYRSRPRGHGSRPRGHGMLGQCPGRGMLTPGRVPNRQRQGRDYHGRVDKYPGQARRDAVRPGAAWSRSCNHGRGLIKPGRILELQGPLTRGQGMFIRGPGGSKGSEECPGVVVECSEHGARGPNVRRVRGPPGHTGIRGPK